MSDRDADDEWIKDQIAFEARFPPEAIAGAPGETLRELSLTSSTLDPITSCPLFAKISQFNR
jgi:hypothetical protein